VLLTGCGKRLEVKPIVTTRTVVEKVQVPEQLLDECEVPQLDDVETTGDLERVAIDAIVSLTFCNEDKAAIREWQSE
jgi:hypothetical protein